jgi:hypothetical protein
MTGRPQSSEAAQYYFRYINRVNGEDVNMVGVLTTQLEETLALCAKISEENRCIVTPKRSGASAKC